MFGDGFGVKQPLFIIACCMRESCDLYVEYMKKTTNTRTQNAARETAIEGRELQ